MINYAQISSPIDPGLGSNVKLSFWLIRITYDFLLVQNKMSILWSFLYSSFLNFVVFIFTFQLIVVMNGAVQFHFR